MGMVRCSVCNDMTSDRSAEAYNGKCPACHRALQKLADKARAGESYSDCVYQSNQERDRKMGTGLVSIAGTGGKFPSDKMREIVEKMQTGQVHLQVPRQTNKSQFMKDLIEVSKKMAEEGAIKMPILPEDLYREKVKREQENASHHFKDIHREEDAETLREEISSHHQGTWVTTEEYDAELVEHPRASDIEMNSRRESALRQLAEEVSDDVLMNLYKECIITRERMRYGKAFGIASMTEIESRLKVYETELGNRLARKGKGK